jgi:hypothetical protein
VSLFLVAVQATLPGILCGACQELNAMLTRLIGLLSNVKIAPRFQAQ